MRKFINISSVIIHCSDISISSDYTPELMVHEHRAAILSPKNKTLQSCVNHEILAY